MPRADPRRALPACATSKKRKSGRSHAAGGIGVQKGRALLTLKGRQARDRGQRQAQLLTKIAPPAPLGADPIRNVSMRQNTPPRYSTLSPPYRATADSFHAYPVYRGDCARAQPYHSRATADTATLPRAPTLLAALPRDC